MMIDLKTMKWVLRKACASDTVARASFVKDPFGKLWCVAVSELKPMTQSDGFETVFNKPDPPVPSLYYNGKPYLVKQGRQWHMARLDEDGGQTLYPLNGATDEDVTALVEEVVAFTRSGGDPTSAGYINKKQREYVR